MDVLPYSLFYGISLAFLDNLASTTFGGFLHYSAVSTYRYFTVYICRPDVADERGLPVAQLPPQEKLPSRIADGLESLNCAA
ncbi:hypothetical protein LAD67_16125 [Escherichia coli]|nr:hypothetical protein [Escherichia coli]